MPHVIVEYSANIEAEITPQRLVEEIHQPPRSRAASPSRSRCARG